MSINMVAISGNVTRDAELRATGSGMSVLNFSVAVNDRRKNQQTGQWEDHANFVDCTLFGNRADAVYPFIRKGTKVTVQGKLHYSTWTDRDGNKRSKLDVTVDELDFTTRERQRQQQAEEVPQGAYAEEEIPF